MNPTYDMIFLYWMSHNHYTKGSTHERLIPYLDSHCKSSRQFRTEYVL